MHETKRPFPGIELHLHLDGAMTPEMLLQLAAIDGVSLPADTPETLEPFVTVDETCTSLVDYLNRFDVTLRVMQSARAVSEAVRLLLCRLAAQGTIYAEIRFAPQLHRQRGLSQREVVQAAIDGLNAGLSENPGMRAQLILCCMRFDDNKEENMETIRMAKEFLDKGVCACDLAGGEIGHPATAYADVFALATVLGVPYTIHGGEACGPESMREALEIGASRIGHGVHSIEDEALMSLLAEKKIPLEMCPTSNLHTKAVRSLAEYPVREFLRRGIRATLNTDNPGISRTTNKQEFSALTRESGLTADETHTLLHNAADAAFLPPTEREALKTLIDERL